MPSQWKRIRYRLEWLGLLLAAKLIPLCSRRVSYDLARTVGTTLSFLDRHRYHVALSNLEAAFGHQFSPYIECQNFEETAQGTGPERSVVIACYHYSNFEWLSLACGFLDLKGTIISQEFKNSLLDPIF